ncbi:trypsin-like peptidase domain-containing protein [Allostreptomyces psammosilenae]|uniref:Putative serine protease PepD n=1 Tax=Allostreptomyces psammosilenae TaxID=1892865 RepID=A0A853A116_9ACTN|nr:trypsin-like peptidase domain-containing protein [Allostreptomyces psammosilenae]NYI08095.1 putative serine protease PepD [Allostreptomyces psammosilenae]
MAQEERGAGRWWNRRKGTETPQDAVPTGGLPTGGLPTGPATPVGPHAGHSGGAAPGGAPDPRWTPATHGPARSEGATAPSQQPSAPAAQEPVAPPSAAPSSAARPGHDDTAQTAAPNPVDPASAPASSSAAPAPSGPDAAAEPREAVEGTSAGSSSAGADDPTAQDPWAHTRHHASTTTTGAWATPGARRPLPLGGSKDTPPYGLPATPEAPGGNQAFPPPGGYGGAPGAAPAPYGPPAAGPGPAPQGAPGPHGAPPAGHGAPHPGHNGPHPGHSGPHPLPARPAPYPYPPAAPGGPGGPGGPHPMPGPAGRPYHPLDAALAVPYAAPTPRGGGQVSRRSAVVIALALSLVTGLAGGFAGATMAGDDAPPVHLAQQGSGAGEERAADSVGGIAQRVLPGVVYISVRDSQGEGSGTGFVLDTEGHILTNNHVVGGAASGGEISVTFDGGQTVEAEVVGADAGYDLAVIRVSNVHGLTPLPLGDSEEVAVGDPVIAIGAPFGLQGTVTSGIISAVDRPVTAGGETDPSDVSYVNALQTDAPINPGNSGGPLVNAAGQVVGINTAIRSAGGGLDPYGNSEAGSIGLGFAIPVNEARRVAEQLINDGHAVHPVIGVVLDMGYTGNGARILDGTSSEGGEPITPGGPGDQAGLQPGDVITAVAGEAVASGDELIVRIRSHEPGDVVEFTVQRDGEELRLPVTLGSSS